MSRWKDSRHRLDRDIARLQARRDEAQAEVAAEARRRWADDRTAESDLDAARIPAGFQREIFQIGDARLTATDAQAGILIAAAVAIATFTGGLVKNGHVSEPGLLTTGSLAIVVTVLALHARRERPAYPGKRSTKMELAGDLARIRVNRVHDLVHADGPPGDATGAALTEFAAWHALSDSVSARREVKDRWYVAAVVVLLFEVGAAIWTALNVNPT
jgi:hypothetical protein